MAKRRKEELLDTGGWKSVAIKRAAWHDNADGNGGLICFTGMINIYLGSGFMTVDCTQAAGAPAALRVRLNLALAMQWAAGGGGPDSGLRVAAGGGLG